MSQEKSWTPERVLELRESHSMSQAKFADFLGYSENYVYMIEKDQRPISPKFVRSLERFVREKKEKSRGRYPEQKHSKGDRLEDDSGSEKVFLLPREIGGSDDEGEPSAEDCVDHVEALARKAEGNRRRLGWIMTQLKMHLPLSAFDREEKDG